MDSLYGQNDNVNVRAGILPYSSSMLPMEVGSDSLFQIAWRGKWFILFSMIAGLGGAYAYSRTLRPQYVSTSRILVSIPESQSQQEIPLPVISKPNLLTQASMITSPAIIDAALKDPNIVTVSMDIGGGFADLLTTVSAKVGKDDIINVTASSPYPKAAAAMVNAVVQGYISWHARNKEYSTEEYLADLRKQADLVARDLKLKRLEVMQAEQRTPEVLDAASDGITSKTLEILKQEYVNARLYAIQQSSYNDRLTSLISDPNRLREYVLERGTAMEDSERARLMSALDETQLRLDELSAGGIVQKSQIALLQNRKNQLLQRITERDQEFVTKQVEIAKALCDDAKLREQNLKGLYEDELKKTQGYGEEKAKYAFLVAECDILDKQFTSLNEQISKVPPGTSQRGVNVYVLEKGVPADNPSPQMARVMGIGLVLGLMVGGGLAFFRDWRDQRVRSADEITAILGVPILGAVPSIPRRRIIHRGARSHLGTQTREFEAYRSIRTALFFGSFHDEAKTLLVTSPGPLEGKTTLVSNLGVAMAHAGQKTLIIDADLRKPMQHRVFAKKGHGKGLVDVLTGTATLEETIRPTDVEGLDVLESGRIVPNPSELLSSEVFWVLFDRLKSRYDRILVDSPPVGIVADAQILATRCGLTLLVLRAQRSSRLVTQRARDALSTVSARVVGAVVNDVPKGDTRYSHHDSGAYSYYYGSREANGPKLDRRELPSGVASHDGNGLSEAQKQG